MQSAQGSLQVLSRRSCSLVQQRAVQREVTPAFSGAMDQHPCLPCAVEPCVGLSADRSQMMWLTQANTTTFIQLFLCLETRKASALNPVITWGFVTVQVSRPSSEMVRLPGGSASASAQWPVDTILAGDTAGTREGPSLTEFVFQWSCPKSHTSGSEPRVYKTSALKGQCGRLLEG